MSRKNHAQNENLEKIEKAISTYELTVNNIKGIACALYEINQATPHTSRTFVGRRFTIMDGENKRTLTPDVSIQISKEFGYVCEVKMSIRRDPDCADGNEGIIKQCKKYDKCLIGWDTESETISEHTIVLLCMYLDMGVVLKTYKDYIDSGKYRFNRRFVVFYSSLDESRGRCFIFQLYRHDEIGGEFEKIPYPYRIDYSKMIVFEELIKMALCDGDPPIPYLANIVHEEVMGMLTNEQNDEMRYGDEKQVSFEISYTELRDVVSKNRGPAHTGKNDPEIPRIRQIRNAVNLLIEMEWARVCVCRKDTVEFICKRRRKPYEQIKKAYAVYENNNNMKKSKKAIDEQYLFDMK